MADRSQHLNRGASKVEKNLAQILDWFRQSHRTGGGKGGSHDKRVDVAGQAMKEELKTYTPEETSSTKKMEEEETTSKKVAAKTMKKTTPEQKTTPEKGVEQGRYDSTCAASRGRYSSLWILSLEAPSKERRTSWRRR